MLLSCRPRANTQRNVSIPANAWPSGFLSINSLGVIETLADVMLIRGIPEHVRSDNGAEMADKVIPSWLATSVPERNTSSLAVHGRTAQSFATSV